MGLVQILWAEGRQALLALTHSSTDDFKIKRKGRLGNRSSRFWILASEFTVELIKFTAPCGNWSGFLAAAGGLGGKRCEKRVNCPENQKGKAPPSYTIRPLRCNLEKRKSPGDPRGAPRCPLALLPSC